MCPLPVVPAPSENAWLSLKSSSKQTVGNQSPGFLCPWRQSTEIGTAGIYLDFSNGEIKTQGLDEPSKVKIQLRTFDTWPTALPNHLCTRSTEKISGVSTANSEHSKQEIKKTIPFTTASKIVKYKRINVAKKVKDLYIEHQNTVLKEMKGLK